MLLQNQTAIVTGAARGIGRGIAATLAGEGANVVLVDIDHAAVTHTAQELAAAGASAVAVAVDITQSAQVAELVRTVVTRFGRVDILVNNAGLVSNTPVLDLSEEEWDRTLAVNLKGVFLCGKHVAQAMATRHSGRIVNIASLAGKVGAPGQAAYCASKHGVIGLTRVMAIDLAPHGINVNAVCPGNTETEMMKYVFTRRAESRGQTFDELAQGILAKTPLGRFGRPEDVAQAVLFFVSPMAAYITGQDLDVDGGRRANLS